jgi:hypothetical protein
MLAIPLSLPQFIYECYRITSFSAEAGESGKCLVPVFLDLILPASGADPTEALQADRELRVKTLAKALINH